MIAQGGVPVVLQYVIIIVRVAVLLHAVGIVLARLLGFAMCVPILVRTHVLEIVREHVLLPVMVTV